MLGVLVDVLIVSLLRLFCWCVVVLIDALVMFLIILGNGVGW